MCEWLNLHGYANTPTLLRPKALWNKNEIWFSNIWIIETHHFLQVGNFHASWTGLWTLHLQDNWHTVRSSQSLKYMYKLHNHYSKEKKHISLIFNVQSLPNITRWRTLIKKICVCEDSTNNQSAIFTSLPLIFHHFLTLNKHIIKYIKPVSTFQD